MLPLLTVSTGAAVACTESVAVEQAAVVKSAVKTVIKETEASPGMRVAEVEDGELA